MCRYLIRINEHAAKRIWEKHNLESCPDADDLEMHFSVVKYDKNYDVFPPTDSFGPVSENAFTLPTSYKVHFVNKKDDLVFMQETLLGSELIGFDLEWLP